METTPVTKCAFITGGSRGIGKGIALVLAEQGYDIAITYNSAVEEAEDTKRQAEALGRRCFFYQASLENPEVPEAVTRQAISDLGRLDVLVNNAGVTKHNSLFTTEVALMDFVYGLDFRAPLLCAKQAALHMRETGIRGSIINITSTRGFRSYPRTPCMALPRRHSRAPRNPWPWSWPLRHPHELCRAGCHPCPWQLHGRRASFRMGNQDSARPIRHPP
jgi:NAD(P)-dependent dehydrogenase (short-subunit alcohol dehydrogenase family)